MEKIIDSIRLNIDSTGQVIPDTRLNRDTKCLHAISQTIEYTNLPQNKKVDGKYIPDWKRMYSSFKKTCEELNLDKFSRRAVILNTSNYQKVQPCFLSMQVLRNEIGYSLIVNQRSSDIEKLPDDIKFFEAIMNKLIDKTGLNMNRLVINFGSVHYELK